MRKIFFVLLCLYCLILAEVLLTGRESSSALSVKDYFMLYANMMPLETLIRYLSFFAARRDTESFLLTVTNIGGNFLLFLPIGFLLPAVFDRMKKIRLCFSVIFCAVLSAELLQGGLRVGVPDIDDLSLNLLGAYVGFLISEKLNFIRRSMS